MRYFIKKLIVILRNSFLFVTSLILGDILLGIGKSKDFNKIIFKDYSDFIVISFFIFLVCLFSLFWRRLRNL